MTLAGCVLEPVAPVEDVTEVSTAPSSPVVEHQLTVQEAPAPPPAPVATMPLLVPPKDPVPFRLGAGYGALAKVDVEGCRERGLQAGYVRVRATFSRVGYVVRASVESPAEPPPAALDCIADELRQAGVPAFDGADVRLSKTYFIAPGGGVVAPPPPPALPAPPAPAVEPPSQSD